jgi:nitrogen-specific signal transduction histidine kinase
MGRQDRELELSYVGSESECETVRGAVLDHDGSLSLRAIAPSDALARLSESDADGLVVGSLAGRDAAAFVRSVRRAHPGLPVVVVASSDSQPVGTLFEAGATDVLRPPPAPDGESRGDAPGTDAADLSDWGREAAARLGNAVGCHRADRPDRATDDATAMIEGRELLDAVFESVPIHLYVKDAQGRHVRVSEAYVDSPEILLGKRDNEIEDIDHGEQTHRDDMRVIEEGVPVLNKEECIDEVDQDNFSVEFLHDQYPGAQRPDESAERWMLTSKVPLRDSDGTVVGLVGVSRDISERKQYQKELERQNERLEKFASIVSHDLRNPLNVASGYLELVQADCESEHLERIADAHDRMSELIEELLRLARDGRDVAEPELTDLAVAVRDAWDLGDTSDADLVLDGDLPTVETDPGRVRELFANLFDNAVTHAGPSVTVRVGPLDGGGLYVADDGPGIPPDDRDRVLDHGYTTDEDGTGFGLAIVTTIADAHDWDVSVTASETGGARFEFRW